jgi:hypothetical protein
MPRATRQSGVKVVRAGGGRADFWEYGVFRCRRGPVMKESGVAGILGSGVARRPGLGAESCSEV